jgi:hypothetical protein
MKYFSIVLNIILLGMLSHLLYSKGAPDGDERVLVTLAFLAPISSLLVFFFSRSKTTEPENLLWLFLKRRKLEEKNRIAALQASKKEQNNDRS